MIQIRIHGRGGQGVVTAAELLSMAAFLDGKYAQAFPSFGSERSGAPVTAFCRINDKEIRAREPVYTPDVLLIQDSTLLHQVDVFGGLSQRGEVLINSALSPGELSISEFCTQHPGIHFYMVPASDIAMKHLGRPLANAALLAGFAAMTEALTEQAVERAIKQKFPGQVGELNAAVAAEAYGFVSSLMSSV